MLWLIVGGGDDGTATETGPTASSEPSITPASAVIEPPASPVGTGDATIDNAQSGRPVRVEHLLPGMCFDAGFIGDDGVMTVALSVVVVGCAEPHEAEVVAVLEGGVDGDERDDVTVEDGTRATCDDVVDALFTLAGEGAGPIFVLPSEPAGDAGNRDVACRGASPGWPHRFDDGHRGVHRRGARGRR